MDAKLKAKWVKALRSGKFEKTTSQLKDGDAYCCLGVLCVVGGLPIDPSRQNSIKGRSDEGYNPLKTFGLTETAIEELYSRNDGIGFAKPHSFRQVADYIEKNL